MPLNNPILDCVLNHISLEDIKQQMGGTPWARQVVATDHVVATAICQEPGHANDRHCHDYDEWWIVLQGSIDWVIEGREEQPVTAIAGDFIYVPALTFHHIFPKGDQTTIRLGVALPGHGHLHEKPTQKVKVTIEQVKQGG